MQGIQLVAAIFPIVLAAQDAFEERARGLVAKLGSDSLEERESAEHELLELGPKALPPVRAALDGTTDPEVRERGARVLSRRRGEGR